MYEEIRQMAQRALSRLNNVIGRGVLNRFTYAKRPTANVSLFDDETYDGIEFASDWGFMSYPPCDKSTELIVGFLRGQRDNGTVLRSFNRKFTPSVSGVTLQEGECVVYNKVTNCYMHFKNDGTIIVKSDKEIDNVVKNNKITIQDAGGLVTIQGQTEVKIKTNDNANFIDVNTNGKIQIKCSDSVTIDSPLVKMTGSLQVQGDVIDSLGMSNSHTVRDMRTIFNNHVHSGVVIGPSNTGASTTTQ